MNINHVLYALEISRCGSINRAAKQLYISQPSLSRAIRDLESEIGITLFERSSKGIVATHQGKEFLKHAEKLDTQYKHLNELYFSGYKPDVFYLSVSSVRYAIACKAVTNLYQRYVASEFQNVCFEEGSLEEVIAHVYDGLFNLGLLITPAEKRDYWRATIASHDLNYKLLNSQNACAFLRAGHPLAASAHVTPLQLADYPHATMAQSDVAPINYCSGINNYDYRTSARRILISDRAALYDILRRTDAYYVGLELNESSECFKGIRFVTIAEPEVQMDLFLIYMQRHVLTNVENEFVEEIEKLVSREK